MRTVSAANYPRKTPTPQGAEMNPLEVLTVDEAAELLRVNRKTLYEAIRLKKVPGVVRLGKVIRLSRAALLAWTSSAAFSENGGSLSAPSIVGSASGNRRPALGEKQ